MRKIMIRLVFLGLAFQFVACGFGYSVHQNFTPLSPTNINCEVVPGNVELLFEGEKIDFEYEKVGLVEVQGEITSNDAELLEKIKMLAKSKCCDVIINLKKSYTSRESGVIFSDEPDRKYSAITYYGIAVKKKVEANQ
jgi:hypothetical protein